MKHIWTSLAALLLIIAFASCDNDFDLIAGKKEIPVVFGLLSITDTIQYVRVERAFSDEEIAPVNLAQVPDSLYYDNATVTITDLSTNEIYNLERVDATQEGFPRNEGAFASTPNYVYKIRTSDIDLVPGREYMLTVQTGENGTVATATTVLPDSVKITNPKVGQNYSFPDKAASTVKWTDDANENGLYDIKLFFDIQERDLSNPAEGYQPKRLYWDLVRGVDEKKYEFDSRSFYQFMSANLEASDQYQRKFDYVGCVVNSGGSELVNYINVLNANNGITSSNEIPIYSNVENGLGIFSSRATSSRSGVEITNKNLDSLRNGSITKDLNFE